MIHSEIFTLVCMYFEHSTVEMSGLFPRVLYQVEEVVIFTNVSKSSNRY